MWRGSVRSEDVDEYVAYIERTGMTEYRETPGNLDAWMLTRDLGDGTTEIVTVSRWESLESISGFAGADIETAVYYPEDDRFLSSATTWCVIEPRCRRPGSERRTQPRPRTARGLGQFEGRRRGARRSPLLEARLDRPGPSPRCERYGEPGERNEGRQDETRAEAVQHLGGARVGGLVAPGECAEVTASTRAAPTCELLWTSPAASPCSSFETPAVARSWMAGKPSANPAPRSSTDGRMSTVYTGAVPTRRNSR